MKIKKLCLLLFLCSALVISALSCKNEVAKPLDLGSIDSNGLIFLEWNGKADKYINFNFRVNVVENATRYYLYYNETNDVNTAKPITDSITNYLTAYFDYSFLDKEIYFWARATNGYKYTNFTNAVKEST